MELFSETLFEHKLIKLKDTHDSIANLSSWCLSNQEYHDKIVSIWLSVLKRVKIEHRVILFYLANDVVQYSKKKGMPFVDSFAPAFQKAVTMVREEAVRPKMERLFSIWKHRGIYDEGFIADLNGLLARGKANRIDISDFQPCLLYSRLKSCKELEDDTDMKLTILTKSSIALTDVARMRKCLKDKHSGCDWLPEVEEGLQKIQNYTNALEVEIKERIGLIDLLELSEIFYGDQLKEARVVVNAYKCFSGRVKAVKKKLEEKVQELPSPPLTPDINAPSPSPSSTPEKSQFNELSFYGVDFSSGGSFMDGSLNNNLLAKALENVPPVPSRHLNNSVVATGSDNNYSPIHSLTTPTLMESLTFNSTLQSIINNPVSSVNIDNSSVTVPGYNPAKELSQKLNPITQLTPITQHTPITQLTPSIQPTPITPTTSSNHSSSPLLCVPPKAYSPSQNLVTESLSVNASSSISLVTTPKQPEEPREVDSCTAGEVNKIEVVTRSQAIDERNLSLSALLQSLIPDSKNSAGIDSGGAADSIIQNTPRSPSPEPLLPNQSIPQKFTLWPEPSREDWASPQSPPNFEKTGFNLNEDIDMRLAFGDPSNRSTDSGKDVDHRNLISLTVSSDVDYRPYNWDEDGSNMENVDMDVSDDDEIKADYYVKNNNFSPVVAATSVETTHPPPTLSNQGAYSLSIHTPPPRQVEVLKTNNIAVETPDLSVPPPPPSFPPPPGSVGIQLTPRRNRAPVSFFHHSSLIPPPPPPPPPLPPHNHWNSSPQLRFPPPFRSPFVLDHRHRYPNHLPRHHPPFKSLRSPHYQRMNQNFSSPRW